MCGVFGYDLRKSGITAERRALAIALLATGNDNRGGDSWGYWSSKGVQRGLGDIIKVAVDLVKYHRFMAHTRKATTGSVTVENSHPFEVGNIIGAHNGIIVNHSELNAKFDRKCSVDSQHIFHHLAENKDLEDLRGYGTIQFVYKDRPDRIYLCKLNGGELGVFGIKQSAEKDSKTIGVLWSSNDSHAKAALKAAGLEYFEYTIETGQVYFVEDGELYKGDKKLALGTRNEYMPDWRNGMTGGYSGYHGGTGWSDGWEKYVGKDEDEPEVKSGVSGSNSSPTPTSNNQIELWKSEEKKRQEMLGNVSSVDVSDDSLEFEDDDGNLWQYNSSKDVWVMLDAKTGQILAEVQS